jgi:hypothetical protein
MKMKILTIKFKILTILIIVTALFGCQKWKDKTVPKELLGVWATTEQRYASCTFEVTDKMIIFSNDSLDHTDINHVTGIEKIIEEGQTLYHIDYKDSEGLKYTLSLIYSKARNRGVVRLKNEMQIEWTKKEANET